jgi:hypothetical protein
MCMPSTVRPVLLFVCFLIPVRSARAAQGAGDAGPGRSGAIPFDTTVYADRATAELVELARIRHGHRSAQLEGYRAKTFTRIEGRVGASRFTGGFSMFRFETAALVHWQQPGDTRIDMLGVRSATPRIPGIDGDQMAGFWTDVLADEPWFIPESMGDEIQLMGIPDEEALHPLAADGNRFYRYAITDSLRMGLPGREVRAIAIRVTPLAFDSVDRGTANQEAAGGPSATPPDSIARDVRQRIADVIAELPTAMEGTDRRAVLLDSLNRLMAHQRLRVRTRRGDRYRPPTLVSGEMWLDADSLDVVRFVVTFVGDNIWDDDDDAPTLIALEADLEYGLHLNRFWLPDRQLLSATFEYKYLLGAKLPTTAITTFSDYEIGLDSAVAVAGELRGGVTGRRFGARWRCEPWGRTSSKRNDRCGAGAFRQGGVREDGTRWEVRVPPMDSLTQYEFASSFGNDATTASDPAVYDRLVQMAHLTEGLPDQFASPKTNGIDWLAAAQAFHFNRVQGPSLGLGLQWHPGPEFTTVHVNGRVSVSDRRFTGGASWRRDGPEGRVDIRGFYEMKNIEPWTRGLTLGNSLRALLLGHDDADYYLAAGGTGTYTGNHGWSDRLELTLRYERQESVANALVSEDELLTGGGRYPPNPPVADGDYLGVDVVKTLGVGPLILEIGSDGLASVDNQSARAWGSAELPFQTDRLRGSVRARGGSVVGDSIPQMLFRVGGPWTVRAFDYGTRRGRSLWSAQLDLEWVVSEWWSPVLFGDVGNVDELRDPLVGAGIGLSLLSGWVRLDLAKGLQPWSSVRFDAAFQIPLN